MPPHPTLFLRRRVLRELGPFDLGYRIAADYEFMLRLLNDLLQKSREDYRAMRGHRVGGALTLAAKNLRKLPQFLG